jgi:hypothetical protein
MKQLHNILADSFIGALLAHHGLSVYIRCTEKGKQQLYTEKDKKIGRDENEKLKNEKEAKHNRKERRQKPRSARLIALPILPRAQRPRSGRCHEAVGLFDDS